MMALKGPQSPLQKSGMHRSWYFTTDSSDKIETEEIYPRHKLPLFIIFGVPGQEEKRRNFI
jgi:hypothetical protein